MSEEPDVRPLGDGLVSVTGKETRRWHPAGTDRVKAEKLAAKLAAEENKRVALLRYVAAHRLFLRFNGKDAK